MKLWLIEQSKCTGPDTYDSAVVVAETEDQARAMHPADGGPLFSDDLTDEECDAMDVREAASPRPLHGRAWTHLADEVFAEYLGEAASGPARVVCASYHAG
jgi:hypothetical protein